MKSSLTVNRYLLDAEPFAEGRVYTSEPLAYRVR
jgi:hypothetical protein